MALASIKNVLKQVPGVRAARRLLGGAGGGFTNSGDYWEQRYRAGGNSGAGSYHRLAEYKAEFLNRFVQEHGITTVLEFGSGDGAQLELASYPSYIGVDVSRKAIEETRRRFAGREDIRLIHSSEFDRSITAELTLSLDVIYHLVEDPVFEGYMDDLFSSASRYVILYSSNDTSLPGQDHVRHRVFTDWVRDHRPDYTLILHEKNRYPFDRQKPSETSFADFYVFERARSN